MSAPSVSIRERLVVGLGGVTFAATAWITGGVELYGLYSFLIGSVLTFSAAVLPMPSAWNGFDGLHGNAINFKRLLKFPVFWTGLLFLIYITIQNLNPSYQQVYGGGSWWAEPISHIDWLPTGVRGNFNLMNGYRASLSFLAMFLMVWALWVGVQRRKSALLVLWAFVLSGWGMALIAMLQKFTGAKAVFWFIPSSNQYFWGSFFYGNQGAAFLCLVLIVAAVLYFYHLNQAEANAQSGGPHLLLFGVVFMLATSIFMAQSRGGILFGGILTLVFLLFALLLGLFGSNAITPLLPRVIVRSLLFSAIVAIVSLVDIKEVEREYKGLINAVSELESDNRVKISKITCDMIQEKPIWGNGPGSWLYRFREYQANYPELFFSRFRPAEPNHPEWKKRKLIAQGVAFYRYAHNDILQFIFEFGLVGCSLLLLGYAYLFGNLLWHSHGNVLSVLMLILGTVVVCGHAFLDFLFQAPAYWIALNALICLVVKLVVLEAKRARLQS